LTIRLELRLLGGFGLRAGGAEVPVTPAVQKILALLGVHDRPLSRPYLAAVLWPATTRERSLASLRSALRGCPDALLRRSRAELGLADHVSVDYRLSMGAARRALAGPVALESVDPALRLLTGDLLPEITEDWIEPFRQARHHLRLDALEAMAEYLLGTGNPDRAARAAAVAVTAEPLRESAHLLLMRALVAEGNRAQAIAHYDALARLLLAELGVEPSFPLSDALSPRRR
jgi:DNA-binding SARP family transcriptional activator